MKLDDISNQVYFIARNEAKLKSHEFVTPEHFLYAALMFEDGKKMIKNSGGDIDKIMEDLNSYFEESFIKTDSDSPSDSFMLMKMFEIAATHVLSSGKNEISLGDLLINMFHLPESFAVYILMKNGVKRLSILRFVSHGANEAKTQQEQKHEPQKEDGVLAKYTLNLTKKAAEGKLDPLIGREDVINRTLQVLSRRLKNNPVHVGDAGVGKTAVVEGIAQRIASGDVPKSLLGANIFYVDMGTIVAGTKYRGDFEERLISILNAASQENNPIIYFDEIHNIVGAGAVSGGSLDATSILKPYFAKGDLRFIGSTTYEEYKKFFERDSALTRRFQRIDIEEPTMGDTVKILNGVKSRYEEFHNVVYSNEVIRIVCELTSRYMLDRKLPDKAIDVIDEAGAFLRMNSLSDEAIEVKKEDVERVIAMMAKIPENSVSDDDIALLKSLESKLKEKVYGQDAAIEAVVGAIKASRIGLNDANKPVASFLFVGPTGVGKTEIAKQLSSILNIKLIRFDMSEYQEAHSVARLIGAPPGYVGYEEGGLMTESIRKNPHCVLLLDEIEKANSDIMNVMLQVMDYGSLTDNIGKKADFRNVIIIMTSNAGARDIGKKIIGYESQTVNIGALHKEVEKAFSPEFRNRLDEIVVFNHIDKAMARLITIKAIKQLSERLNDRNITIKPTEKAIVWIAEKGLSEKYGAREIIRIVDKEIKKALTDKILFENMTKGKITIAIKDNRIIIK